MTDATSAIEKLKLACWPELACEVADFQAAIASTWAPALLAADGVVGLQLHVDENGSPRPAGEAPPVVASIWCEAAVFARERAAIAAAEGAWRPQGCVRVDAWRVHEIRAKRYDRDWPDGEASPGVTQYSLMRAADGRSADACRQHWREVHRPLALRIHVGLWSYVQDHVQETLTSTGGDVIGHAQLHFRSHADMREKLFDSEAGKREIFADIGNFMSLERTGVALMTERWLRTPESLRD